MIFSVEFKTNNSQMKVVVEARKIEFQHIILTTIEWYKVINIDHL